MASRQQVLLQDKWVARLSECVDTVCTKIGNVAFRQVSKLQGPSDEGKVIEKLSDVVGKLSFS